MGESDGEQGEEEEGKVEEEWGRKGWGRRKRAMANRRATRLHKRVVIDGQRWQRGGEGGVGCGRGRLDGEEEMRWGSNHWWVNVGHQ